jgi:hypothetical protein
LGVEGLERGLIAGKHGGVPLCEGWEGGGEELGEGGGANEEDGMSRRRMAVRWTELHGGHVSRIGANTLWLLRFFGPHNGPQDDKISVTHLVEPCRAELGSRTPKGHDLSCPYANGVIPFP